MPIDLEFEERERYLYVRVAGEMTVESLRQAYTQIGQHCKDRQLRRVLTDTRGLEGSLSTFDVYELGAGIGTMGLAGMERIAVLDRRRPDNQHEFAELVVHNRGVDLRVFVDEHEAMSWLLRDDDDGTGGDASG